MRWRLFSDASLRCAIDHRNEAMGTSLFSFSNRESNSPTDASRVQCMVKVMPCCAAHLMIS